MSSLTDLTDLVFHSARTGDVDTLSRALAEGFAATAVNARGDSVLMAASYNEQPACVRVLLERDADPNQRDATGQTPLAGVAFKGLVDMATLLVEGGADLNAAAADGRTPLMMAGLQPRADGVVPRGARCIDRRARGRRTIRAGPCASDGCRSRGNNPRPTGVALGRLAVAARRRAELHPFTASRGSPSGTFVLCRPPSA
jgi:hypothetical protein